MRRMTNGPDLKGSPCRTAIFAPLGIAGGAGPHLMSLGLTKRSLALAFAALARPARMTAITILVIVALLDVFIRVSPKKLNGSVLPNGGLSTYGNINGREATRGS